LHSMAQRGLSFHALIVGDGPERSALEAAIPRATFLGSQDNEALARAYASSDIFFFPSESESFGNVTLEAMASGLPAVCANATGSRSLVSHNVTGYLGRESHEFIDLLTTLLSNSDLRARMGAAARARALHYRWDAILDDLCSLYLHLVGR
jgi:phosphatidylinositol alpha 1,6-mannosyltransferase